jgi:hypothetical protein
MSGFKPTEQKDRSIGMLISGTVLPLLMSLNGWGAPLGDPVRVDDARPLEKAAEIIQMRYGVPIFYEDPNYAYRGDLVDKNSEYRRTHPGVATSFAPKGGTLSLDLPGPVEAVSKATITGLLQSLLDQHERNGNISQFKLMDTGEGIAIVPTATRDKLGSLAPDRSLLDLRISFPEEERSFDQTIEVFCQAVSAASSGIEVGYVGQPVKRLLVRAGATNEIARDVLVRIFANMHPEGVSSSPAIRVSWRLFSAIESGNSYSYLLRLDAVLVERPGANGTVTRAPVLRGDPLTDRLLFGPLTGAH